MRWSTGTYRVTAKLLPGFERSWLVMQGVICPKITACYPCSEMTPLTFLASRSVDDSFLREATVIPFEIALVCGAYLNSSTTDRTV